MPEVSARSSVVSIASAAMASEESGDAGLFGLSVVTQEHHNPHDGESHFEAHHNTERTAGVGVEHGLATPKSPREETGGQRGRQPRDRPGDQPSAPLRRRILLCPSEPGRGEEAKDRCGGGGRSPVIMISFVRCRVRTLMFLAYPPAAWLRSIELIIEVKSWFS
jgi:hypothetical protein